MKLRINQKSPCIFTKGLPEEIDLPIAHGEGKFIIEDKKVMADLLARNLHAMTYVENPNGSMHGIAGITNAAGTCFGLMPHPERYFFTHQRPDRPAGFREAAAAGYQFFRNAVDYVS